MKLGFIYTQIDYTAAVAQQKLSPRSVRWGYSAILLMEVSARLRVLMRSKHTSHFLVAMPTVVMMRF